MWPHDVYVSVHLIAPADLANCEGIYFLELEKCSGDKGHSYRMLIEKANCNTKAVGTLIFSDLNSIEFATKPNYCEGNWKTVQLEPTNVIIGHLGRKICSC